MDADAPVDDAPDQPPSVGDQFVSILQDLQHARIPHTATAPQAGSYSRRIRSMKAGPAGGQVDVLRPVCGKWDRANIGTNAADQAPIRRGDVVYRKVHLVEVNATRLGDTNTAHRLISPMVRSDKGMPMFVGMFSSCICTFSNILSMKNVQLADIRDEKFTGYIDVYMMVEREPFIQTCEWMLDTVIGNGALQRLGSGTNFALDPEIRNYGVRGVYVRGRLDKADLENMSSNWTGTAYCDVRFKLSLNLTEDQSPADPTRNIAAMEVKIVSLKVVSDLVIPTPSELGNHEGAVGAMKIPNWVATQTLTEFKFLVTLICGDKPVPHDDRIQWIYEYMQNVVDPGTLTEPQRQALLEFAHLFYDASEAAEPATYSDRGKTKRAMDAKEQAGMFARSVAAKGAAVLEGDGGVEDLDDEGLYT